MSAGEERGGHRQRTPGRSATQIGDEEGEGPLTGLGLRRVGVGILGVVLLVRGLRRGRSVRGIATALAGGWLLSRAIRSGSGVPTGGAGGEPGAVARRLPSLLQSSRDEPGASERAIELERSVTVGLPAEELHDYWREPEELSAIVGHFAEVEPGDGTRYRWSVPGRWGTPLGWESRLSVDSPGEVLRWETLPGADVPNEGAVRFRPAPGDRGTEVEMTVRFDPPGGPLGRALVSALPAIPETVVETSLRRFKSLAETGEVPTLEGNPSARGRGDLV